MRNGRGSSMALVIISLNGARKVIAGRDRADDDGVTPVEASHRAPARRPVRTRMSARSAAAEACVGTGSATVRPEKRLRPWSLITWLEVACARRAHADFLAITPQKLKKSVCQVFRRKNTMCYLEATKFP